MGDFINNHTVSAVITIPATGIQTVTLNCELEGYYPFCLRGYDFSNNVDNGIYSSKCILQRITFSGKNEITIRVANYHSFPATVVVYIALAYYRLLS